jgi:hypothetical protein
MVVFTLMVFGLSAIFHRCGEIKPCSAGVSPAKCSHTAGGTPALIFAVSWFCVLAVVFFCRQFIVVPSLDFGLLASLPGLVDFMVG